MPSTHPSDPFERIVRAIKTCCRQTADYRDPTHNQFINAYLKTHLSSPDWTRWQRFQPSQQAAFVFNQDGLPDDALSLQAFKRLLSQYKRAGYERYQFWVQAQAESTSLSSPRHVD